MARFGSMLCFFWFSTPAPGIRHDAAVPWFKANLAASILIRWPLRFLGLVWNWLLCFQNALSDERKKCFPVDFASTSLMWHNHGWWILTVVWNIFGVLLNPRRGMVVCIQYVCVCVFWWYRVCSQLARLSWGLTQSHKTPLCLSCSLCHPHFLHRDNGTI